MSIKVYTLELSRKELELLEEALYARSALLVAIGDQFADNKNIEEANKYDLKADKIEALARKVTMPLDKEYIQNYNVKGGK